MIDYQNLRLFHQHGSEWGELRPREPHDPADLDPEQRYGSHTRFFRCERCAEDVMVVGGDQGPGEPLPR
jgi:hypothetical protein